MIAKTSLKLDSKRTISSNDRWVFSVPTQAASLFMSGLQKKGRSTSPVTSAKLQNQDVMSSRTVTVDLGRLRSAKPNRRLVKMRSKSYRSEISVANTGNRLAFQIRLLREKAGLTQADLARRLKTRQSAVARMEDPNYGKHSLAVLHKIASVFDVSAWVEFVPFSTLLQRTTNLSPQELTPASYKEEFDLDGDPNTSVLLRIDGSAICLSHYIHPMGNASAFYLPKQSKS